MPQAECVLVRIETKPIARDFLDDSFSVKRRLNAIKFD